MTSNRYYIADADFLVGMEGDATLLHELDAALRAPVWTLSLGRKSFVPSKPVHIPWRPEALPGPKDIPGIVELPIDETLKKYPWFRYPLRSWEPPPKRLRMVMDRPYGATNEIRRDVPISFANREFTVRCVETQWVEVSESMVMEEHECTSPS